MKQMKKDLAEKMTEMDGWIIAVQKGLAEQNKRFLQLSPALLYMTIACSGISVSTPPQSAMELLLSLAEEVFYCY